VDDVNQGNKVILRRTTRCGVAFGLLLCMLLPVALADDVDVSIKGISDPLATNVRKSLSLAAKHKKSWSGAKIQRLYRLAPGEIKTALQPYGYYNPVTKRTLKPPQDANKTWQAIFQIDHGPATTVTRLHLGAQGPGSQRPAIQKALHQTHLAKGKRLVQSDYTATKSALYNAAYQAGYLDAHFAQSAIRVNPKTNTAEIDLVLDTGPRYYFGRVRFNQHLLNDAFLHRFVPFAPGQPFNAQSLTNLQLALTDSDYFSAVSINAQRNNARRHAVIEPWFYDLLYPPPDPLENIGQLRVPVVVTAKPSKPQSYRISAGYGTDTGPRLGLGVKLRHINRSGHQFHVNLRASRIRQTLQSAYDIPIENVATDKLSFTGHITNEVYVDISSVNYGIGAIRDTGWKLGRIRAYIDLQREDYDLKDGAGTRHSVLLFPGYTMTLRRADNLLNPHKGISLTADVHGGSSAVASSTNFVRGDLRGAGIWPVTHKLRLVLHGEFGASAVSDFAKLPPSQRFFAGGERSVRGYSYQSISPTNRHNDQIGGQYLAVGGIETDYWVYKNYGIAAFYDVGDAADSLDFHFRQGVGIGFRWASPVGLVRLDLAHPLNHSHTPVRVGFSLGPLL
jgi:translocation and assembly module TamA